MTIVSDDPGNAAAVRLEQRTIARDESLTFAMRAGGGYLACLVPAPEGGR